MAAFSGSSAVGLILIIAFSPYGQYSTSIVLHLHIYPSLQNQKKVDLLGYKLLYVEFVQHVV